MGVDRGTVGDWERGVRLPAEERIAAVEGLLSPGGGKPVSILPPLFFSYMGRAVWQSRGGSPPTAGIAFLPNAG